MNYYLAFELSHILRSSERSGWLLFIKKPVGQMQPAIVCKPVSQAAIRLVMMIIDKG